MKFVCLAAILIGIGGFWYANAISQPPAPESPAVVPAIPPGAQVITLGMGCFWHTEAVFKQVPGVVSVTAGYMGGTTANPTHEQVSRGKSGHTEVARVVYDPTRTSLEKILQVFWTSHKLTQSNSIAGRSVIFYYSPEQQQAAEKSMSAEAKLFSKPITTQISPAQEFYVAEAYNQDYYAKAAKQCSVP
ncbi:MAG TPA: peptide-methionine (S)-S-oxide reductase MsrA [Verrucomicrobiae bacterium]|jgi:peptide-methionine (S)-S-oxide reductase|nr:peptide-methionine (S)-S-oxide reductase MsrA [Verrucomicrobiae bacterium]